jgi:hypothetical protein
VKAEILEIAKQKHIISNGGCGTYFGEIIFQLQVTPADFEKTITEMYNDDQIDIRTGINGYLVMHKKTTND